MRRAILGFYTYLEFYLFAVFFLVPMGLSTLRRGQEPGMRHRGRWMRLFGRLTSGLTPLWRFSFDGAAPADIGEKPYVVVSNHESTSDPFLLSYLPFDARYIAKEELFRLPLLGWLMKLGGDIPVRRGDKESVVKMHAECLATLKAGVCVLMFPEGTRSPDGELLPFKDGAFRLAIEAQAPVLPVAVSGTRQCRPKGSLWFGDAKAKVRILEPISTVGMTAEDVPRLRELCRDRIAQTVRVLRAELGHASEAVEVAPQIIAS